MFSSHIDLARQGVPKVTAVIDGENAPCARRPLDVKTNSGRW